MTDFHLCSTCMSYSQASLCHYTRTACFIKLELAFVDLRYFLGDYRPSQTNHFKMSLFCIYNLALHYV